MPSFLGQTHNLHKKNPKSVFFKKDVIERGIKRMKIRNSKIIKQFFELESKNTFYFSNTA